MFSLSSMVFVGSGPVFTSRFTRCSCIPSFNRLNPRFEASSLSLSNTKPRLSALLRAASKIEAKKKEKEITKADENPTEEKETTKADEVVKEITKADENPTEEKETTKADEVVKLTKESPEKLPAEEATATATEAKDKFNFHAKKRTGKQKNALKAWKRIAGAAARGARIIYKNKKNDQKLGADKMEIADALSQEEKTDQSTAEKPSKEN